MSIAICRSCTRYVDTDFSPMNDDEICESCEDAGDYHVCIYCGSANLVIAGKHGFSRCNNCDKESYPIFASEFETSEQNI